MACSARIPWEELRRPVIVKAKPIGCAIAILGQFAGVNAVLYYGPEIFANAGFAAQDSTFSTVSVFLVYIFAQTISISAVVFVLLSEMYPNKVRGG